MTRYKVAIVLIRADDAVMCKEFLSTLDETTQEGFNTLPDGSIRNFVELSKSFLAYFSINIQRKRHFSYMCTIKQTWSKSLMDFLWRWKKEVGNVYDFNGKAVLPIFTQALR